jgi:hypothetical protein
VGAHGVERYGFLLPSSRNYLCYLLADRDGTPADKKKQKSLVPLASPVKHAPAVADLGFNEGPFGPAYAAAEQSVKIECGCCFDDQCSFVSCDHVDSDFDLHPCS